MIDAHELIAATGCAQEIAWRYLDWINMAARKWHIDTPRRLAAWLAQCAHESARFTRLEESMMYTTPARLIAVWPTRFRLPATEREAKLGIFPDDKRNARHYVRSPESLAEYVYGGRLGNGPEGSGDGFRYIGRGFIQLTGRDNYARYSQASGHNIVDAPDMLTYPKYCADSAGWFWSDRRCNELADDGDWEALTRRINGALNGFEDRLALHQRAEAALA